MKDYDTTLDAGTGIDPLEAEQIEDLEWHRKEVEDAQKWLAQEEASVVEARAALARRTAEYEAKVARYEVRS